MPYSWRTLPSGAVEVDGKTPELRPAELAVFRSQVMRWKGLAEKHGARVGVPVHWILGVIFAETAGNPGLTSSAGAFGLMQVMPFNWGGRTKQQMADPDTNMLVGSAILAGHMRRMGQDLPKVASGYNAGASAKTGAPHPSSSSPWGMRENTGYISKVVAASNTALRELGSAPGPKAPAPPAAGRSDAETMLAAAIGALKLIRWLT